MEIDYDFNGSLRLTDVLEDFFYSRSTGLYVFRHPPVVDARLRKGADELGIALHASPEKWMVNVPMADALRLLRHLGSTAMSLPEYFRVRRDAIDAGDRDMVASLESDQFVEMLDTVFVHDRVMIHHPEVRGRLDFAGTEIPVRTPDGRYGWIHPDDIDPATGLPTKVTKVRDVDDDTLKYWDSHTDIGRDGTLMAVRGYVTSVGKSSLDLGFPADAISPKMTIRECRRSLPGGVLPPQLLAEARRILGRYYAEDRIVEVPPWAGELRAFIRTHGDVLRAAQDVAAQVLKEDLRDALGLLWTVALARGRKEEAEDLKRTAREFSGIADATDDGFRDFLKSRREAMARAVRDHESIVFVRGHDNPDTDTVVSSTVEAYRQHLLRGGESAFIPVIPGNVVPEEAAELLGPGLAGDLLFIDDPAYATASRSGRPEWILVDHNLAAEQSGTRMIIDHHYPSAVSQRQQIPRRIRFAGSACALVAQKFYGLGVELPPLISRLLHGATLMDTENRFPGKMTPPDVVLMDRLRDASGLRDESAFYQRLMHRLVDCRDADRLFGRDYKEDWNFFGFSVAKSIGVLDAARAAGVDRLRQLARENNLSLNLPLTLVKIVDYAEDAETIRRERMLPVFADDAAPDFRKAVREAIVTVVRHESGAGVRIEEKDDAIDYWGIGTQLSRKKLAPVLDPVVAAFNRYFWSAGAKLYLKRDFLRRDARVEEIARRHGMRLHSGPDGVVVGNPAELKFLLQEMGLEAASPAEFFKAYFDALRVNDELLVASLTSPRYLETLDLIVEDKSVLVEHPRIVRKAEGWGYDGGQRRAAAVPVGEPGLIDPKKIDLSTGLPGRVEDPRQYGTGLWRYWSPDSDRAWALRSTIFAYDIPSLDLKFGFSEALPRLAIRPCVRAVKHPRVRVVNEGKKIRIDIQEPEGA